MRCWRELGVTEPEAAVGTTGGTTAAAGSMSSEVSLKDALAVILEKGSKSLNIIDTEDEVVGSISIDELLENAAVSEK